VPAFGDSLYAIRERAFWGTFATAEQAEVQAHTDDGPHTDLDDL
jgi:hypothetical protein